MNRERRDSWLPRIQKISNKRGPSLKWLIPPAPRLSQHWKKEGEVCRNWKIGQRAAECHSLNSKQPFTITNSPQLCFLYWDYTRQALIKISQGRRGDSQDPTHYLWTIAHSGLVGCHCLQLCTLCWAHQACTGKPTITRMTLVNFGRPQNTMNRHEHERNICGEGRQGW